MCDRLSSRKDMSAPTARNASFLKNSPNPRFEAATLPTSDKWIRSATVELLADNCTLDAIWLSRLFILTSEAVIIADKDTHNMLDLVDLKQVTRISKVFNPAFKHVRISRFSYPFLQIDRNSRSILKDQTFWRMRDEIRCTFVRVTRS